MKHLASGGTGDAGSHLFFGVFLVLTKGIGRPGKNAAAWGPKPAGQEAGLWVLSGSKLDVRSECLSFLTRKSVALPVCWGWGGGGGGCQNPRYSEIGPAELERDSYGKKYA